MSIFNINFNNNEKLKKKKKSAYECKSDASLLNEFDTKGLFILNFKKHDFAEKLFVLMFVYRKTIDACPRIF